MFLAWDEARQRLVQALLGCQVPLRVLVMTRGEESLPLGVMEHHADHFHVLPLGKVAEKLAVL